MLVTDEVSKPLRSRDVSEEQFWNIEPILVTFEVSKLLVSTCTRLTHPLNIEVIAFIFDVFTYSTLYKLACACLFAKFIIVGESPVILAPIVVVYVPSLFRTSLTLYRVNWLLNVGITPLSSDVYTATVLGWKYVYSLS